MKKIVFCPALFPLSVCSREPADGSGDPHQEFDTLQKLCKKNSTSANGNVDWNHCTRMLNIARALKNDSLLSVAYDWLGLYYLINKGDNTAALEYFFKGIPLAEKSGDKSSASSLYFDISMAYTSLGNLSETLKNIQLGGANLKDTGLQDYYFLLIQYQDFLAHYYVLAHQPDSALHFVDALNNTNRRLHIITFQSDGMGLAAIAYERKGDWSTAERLYREADRLADSSTFYLPKILIKNAYTGFLIRHHDMKGTKAEAQSLLYLGTRGDNLLMQLAGTGFLRQIYDSTGGVGSAYKYANREILLRDSIFSQSNPNKIQWLAFNDQQRRLEAAQEHERNGQRIKLYGSVAGLVIAALVAFFQWRNVNSKQKAYLLLRNQKKQIEEQKALVESAMQDLKSTQSQLVQSEKMASLGEMTSGIAHEILNPLNFVNNFAEMNAELIEELKAEAVAANTPTIDSIANLIASNERKISYHGKRADAIVKAMLQHAQKSTTTRELTDINYLVEEYLRLAYQSFEAKNPGFAAERIVELGEGIGALLIIPSAIGRVLLNIFDNAFYAMQEKGNRHLNNDRSCLTVGTKKTASFIVITIRDNGIGIAEKNLSKIYQPFFTTKPTGQGTGLGLSLSYDIIKAHGGNIFVDSIENEFTVFSIHLPV